MGLIPLVTSVSTVALVWWLRVLRRELDPFPSLQIAVAVFPLATRLWAILATPAPWWVLSVVPILLSLVLLLTGLWHAIDRQPLPLKAESVTLTTEDEVQISAHLGRRGNPDVLLIAHSLGGSPFRPSLASLADSLARQADPLLIELRGHGASGGRVDGGEWLDIAAAVSYACRQGYRRIHLLGISIGAMAVLRCAAERDQVVSVAVISPPGRSERVSTVLSLYASWPGRLLARLHGAALARPTPDLLRRFRPGAEPAARLRGCRLLVMGCERDFLFPAADAWAVYRAAPTPKKLVLFRGVRHGPYIIDRHLGKVTSLISDHLARSGGDERTVI